jgi:ribosome-binding factor A
MASPRVRKVADRIKVVVAEMLERRIKDPRLGFVTITDVRLTGDGQQASIFYTVLNGDREETQKALDSAKGLIRSEVSKQLGTRIVPTLTFIADALPETAREIEDALAKARAADEELAAARAGAQYASEEDPYKKPRVIEDEDDEDEVDEDDEE